MTKSLGMLTLAGALLGCAVDDAGPAPERTDALLQEARGRGALASGGAVVLPPGQAVHGRTMAEWSVEWYRWHFGVPEPVNPALHLEEDCGVGQDGPVFFLPVYDNATEYTRTCRVPASQPVYVPLWLIINDHPCPDPTFEPAPGQSMEDFLREGVRAFNDGLSGLTVTVNGRPVDAGAHRHTSGLFQFQADPSLVGHIPDPCLTGGPQEAVVDGWGAMLQLAPGQHTVRVQAVAPWGAPYDYSWTLDVQR